MRDIKFRVWNDVDEVYTYFTLRDLALNGFGYRNDWDCYYWLQYTGLTDKNGKEIYEGDILRVLDCDGFPGNPNNYSEAFYEIKFGKYIDSEEAAQVGFYYESDVNGICGMCNHDLWLVMGNIYENPELIKE